MAAVVITGAAGDIGQALAESFLADGLTVYGADIVPVEPRDGLVPVRLDVTVRDAVLGLAERAAAEAGPLRLWINAAGIVRVVKVLEAGLEDWTRIIAISLSASETLASRGRNASPRRDRGPPAVERSGEVGVWTRGGWRGPGERSALAARAPIEELVS